GKIKHVSGLVVRQMNLQQVQPGVDSIDQPKAPGQQVDGPDAAIGQAVDALGDLILNVAGGHHRLRTATQVRLSQTALNPALAVGQFLTYDLVHSKSLRASGVRQTRYLMKHRKSPGISSFHENFFSESQRLRLIKD